MHSATASNAYIESFNGKFREECLNENWFISLSDAQQRSRRSGIVVVVARPHSGLDDRTPAEFARAFAKSPTVSPVRSCSIAPAPLPTAP